MKGVGFGGFRAESQGLVLALWCGVWGSKVPISRPDPKS